MSKLTPFQAAPLILTLSLAQPEREFIGVHLSDSELAAIAAYVWAVGHQKKVRRADKLELLTYRQTTGTAYEVGEAVVFAASGLSVDSVFATTSPESAGSVEAKCFWLSFHRARAIMSGSIFRSCHHSRSCVVCVGRGGVWRRVAP